MKKKSFRPRFLNIPPLFVLCLLIIAPVRAQDATTCDMAFARFKQARKASCGQRGEALRLGKYIVEKFANDKENKQVVEYVKKQILIIEKEEAACQKNASEKSPFNLYEQFKAAELLRCGQRGEAVRLGKLILEQYQLAERFGATFKVRLAVLEEEEARCSGKYIEKSLADLYSDYQTVRKLPCGQRADAIRIGREIAAKFSDKDADFVLYVKKQIPVLEREETDCNNADSLAVLFEDFKKAKKLSCGQRAEALRLGREINEKFSHDELNREVVEYVKNSTAQIEAAEKECRSVNSLANLLEQFKNAGKLPCGNRENVRNFGKKIIDIYGNDESKQEIVSIVEKEMASIGYQDYVCERDALLSEYYKNKNWGAFLSLSKSMLPSSGNNPGALDAMLTFVLIAYKNTAHKGSDLYNGDAIFYAKKAIDLIEDGVKTQSNWGTYEPFETKEKALAWMNYTIGYISYFRQKEGKKAIPYFYKAAQYKSEFKYDAFVYHAVAIHYFEKEAVTISSLTINQFINKANSPGRSTDAAKNDEIAMLYKQLVNLYNLRYGLEANENVSDLTDYILKLINRPLINTANTKSKTAAQAGY